jgi:AraC family transcriptional regulator
MGSLFLGGLTMDFQIYEKPAFLVTGKVLLTSQANNTIPEFWQQCNQDGSSELIGQYVACQNIGNAMLGVCFDGKPDGTFRYMIGVETPAAPTDTSLETIEVPASTWLAFESIGPMPQAIQNLWQRIYKEFLPSSNYNHAGTADLEVYYPGNTAAADYRCEVWIPVVKK